MLNQPLTYERLHEVLHYGPVTGTFTRKLTLSPKAIAGQIAGWKMVSGYIGINIDNTIYYAHRLAWLYVNGFFPENCIDHINRIRDDNRFINLREVSQSCNTRNSKTPKNNTSNIRGVTFDRERNKWMAQIFVSDQCCGLGRYDDFDEAVCARLAGEQSLSWSGCDSSSDAYLYVKKMLCR